MKNLIKIKSMMVITAVITFFLYSCEDDGSDKLTGSNPDGNAVDVSERITGYSPSIVGGGATLTVLGTGLSDVDLVLLGESTWISEFEASNDSLEFLVPTFAPIGMNDLTLVFSGAGRANGQFEVVPNPSFNYYTPRSGSTGDTITLVGTNLTYVVNVAVGKTDASIISTTLTDERLQFLMPDVTSGPIVVTSDGGNLIESEDDLISCTSDPDNLACLPPINTNGSFENAALGAADGVEGWGGLNGTLAEGVITDEDSYDGFQSVKITVNDVGANPWNIQPATNFEVDPTATYRLSIWVKGTGILTADFQSDENGSPGYNRYDGQSPGEIEAQFEEWTEISWEFSPTTEAAETNGDGVSRFAISLSYEDNIGGTIYMDNLRVVRIN